MLGPWALMTFRRFQSEFASGDPFPLLVIDGFLEESFAEELLSEFPSIDAMNRTKDYVFGDKREEADFAKAGPCLKAYYDLPDVRGSSPGIIVHGHWPQALR